MIPSLLSERSPFVSSLAAVQTGSEGADFTWWLRSIAHFWRPSTALLGGDRSILLSYGTIFTETLILQGFQEVSATLAEGEA